MKLAKITPFLSVADQLTEQDLGSAAAQGYRLKGDCIRVERPV